MKPSRIRPTKSVDGVRSEDLTELVFSEEDWKDFHRGMDCFNSGKFWHAHEAWEQVWRRHPEDSRLFIQGLILMAAGFHLFLEKKNYSGANSNFVKALSRLRLFDSKFMNLPVSKYIKAIENAMLQIRQLEKGERTTAENSVVPIIAFLDEGNQR